MVYRVWLSLYLGMWETNSKKGIVWGVYASHFILYDFEAILAPLNGHPTYDLTYLSRHTSVRVAIHDAFGGKLVYFLMKIHSLWLDDSLNSSERARSNSCRYLDSDTHFLKIFKYFQVRIKKNGSNGLITGFNPLSTNFTKWSNTLKQFVGNLPTNCLSVFDYSVGLTL